jgi:hypothetical protein
MLVVLAVPAAALATDATNTTVVSRVSGAETIVRHVERVEIGDDGAVVVMDVDGTDHEVEVDLSGAIADIEERLTDGETGLVDLVAIPMVAGAVLRLSGLLLRLGRL